MSKKITPSQQEFIEVAAKSLAAGIVLEEEPMRGVYTFFLDKRPGYVANHLANPELIALAKARSKDYKAKKNHSLLEEIRVASNDKYLTASTVCQEYNISVDWVRKNIMPHINVLEVDNPHYKSALPMKLVRLSEVRAWANAHSGEVQAAQSRKRKNETSPAERWEREKLARAQAAKDAIERAKIEEQRRIRKREREDHKKHKIQEYFEKIKGNVPYRKVLPETVELHLGPTNSGKTHDAVQFLAKEGKGVFASPLRMLAREVYETLSLQLGSERVGLMTGEEQINPDADIICCTAEMAPMQGEVLVLDEIHWISDPDRGWAWLKLLLGGEYKHIRICGPVQAEKVIHKAIANSINYQTHYHSRLAPLTFVGGVTIGKIPYRSVIVAFSKKAVLALAREIQNASGQPVGALYGALPPSTRVEQIRKFVKGEYKYLVSTDVIGHGVNLPCDNIAFAQTVKFDGSTRRDLYPWEAAQIAGRAGRFGLATEGRVYILHSKMGLEVNKKLVEEGCNVAVGTKTDQRLENIKGVLRPTLAQLGNPPVEDLVFALAAWKSAILPVLQQHPWILSQNVSPLIERANSIREMNVSINVEDAWAIIMAPIDAENIKFSAYIKAVAGTDSLSRFVPSRNRIKGMSLDVAEVSCKDVRDLRCFNMMFPDKGELDYQTLLEAEEALSSHISELIPQMVKNAPYGKCSSCGASCPPWFSECNSCHTSHRYNNYYDNDDEWDD